MTELYKHALLEELAKYLRLENAWVRLREPEPIRVRKGKEQSWRLAEVRTELKTCGEIVLIPIRGAGKS